MSPYTDTCGGMTAEALRNEVLSALSRPRVGLCAANIRVQVQGADSLSLDDLTVFLDKMVEKGELERRAYEKSPGDKYRNIYSAV